MVFNIYQEHINYAHKDIKYYLMVNCQQFGQHQTIYIEWAI
jgi:hypothetical protein